MKVDFENDELQTHHNLSKSYTMNYEEQLNKIISFIHQHGNPFAKGEQPLKNFVTQEVPTPATVNALLNIFSTGCDVYATFYKERFVDKSKSLSDTISKHNLSNFRTVGNAINIPKAIPLKKQSVIAEKLYEIAKLRGYSLQKFFSFELVTSNLLYNDDGTLTKETKKYLLEKELETVSKVETSLYLYNLSDFTVIVDVMYFCQ